ncbi:MAG: hypothetical protein KDA79_25440, partial [Planctomycetaceae bacterium]|nr:hypothetical protein [Planctomycetaceae bacterium]
GVTALEVVATSGSYFALYCGRPLDQSLEQLLSSVPIRQCHIGLWPRYEYLGGLVAQDSRDLFVRVFQELFEFELIVLEHRD